MRFRITRQLVADLAPKGARLSKLDVMRVGWTPATDQARLRAHEVTMRFIAFEDGHYESDCVDRAATKG
jgi:hypothetical protein